MGVVGSGVARGHGVARRACVRWAMGSSMSFSVLFLVSVGDIMSTLGDESVGVCMSCTLGACAGGDFRGVAGFLIGLLTNCIVGFVCAFPVGSLGRSMGALLRWGYVGTFLVQCLKIL